jgi:hypothetical protein
VRYNTDLRDVEMFEGPSIGWQAQDTARNLGGHNLLFPSNLYASAFGAEGIWTITNNSTEVLAPDGSTLTTKAVSGTSGNTYFWIDRGGYVANTPYTHSVWVRVASGTGSITITAYPHGQATYTATTEWQRISVSFTPSNTFTYVGVVSPTASRTFYFWGWQVEQSASVSPYVKTVGAPSPTPTVLNGYRTHTYTTTGTSGFTPLVSGNVEVLVVAGGGAGGNNHAGGGGGGGVVYNANYPVIAGRSYTVVVGAGGVASGTGVNNNTNGGNSQFGTLVAIGGGAGGNRNDTAGTSPGQSGGSGGGGGGAQNSGALTQNYAGGAGTNGQGNPGGVSIDIIGAGGGGAGAPGESTATVSGYGGTGGAGLQFSISGTPTWYAGGGSGSNGNNTTPANPLGGGGAGGSTAGSNGTAGTANTGGGGGGGGAGNTTGSNGGSGIVIVRYRYE